MKLVLKRVERCIETTSLADSEVRTFGGVPSKGALFALHTDAGEQLPCQVSTSMLSEASGPVRLTVVFIVDGDKIRVEGHGL
jgi:hypothetical protein